MDTTNERAATFAERMAAVPALPSTRPSDGWGDTLTFRRVGNMTYEVRHDGILLGHVWRTRTGWSAARLNGLQVVDDYPGSRKVAAANLRLAVRDAQ